MSVPWDRKRTGDPITRAQNTAPSLNREFQHPPPPPRAQSLSYRQLLQQRLQRHQRQSTFSVDCSGQHNPQQWKVSFFLGSTMIGESGWFTNKDVAKEDAAKQALAWLDTHYTQSLHSVAAGLLSNSGVQLSPVPPPPPSEVQPLSNRQLLYERLQRYQLQSTFSVDRSDPEHAQQWKVSFFLGSTMIGESDWFMNKDAAKEDAAMQALAWLDTRYTQFLHSGAATPLSNGEVQTPPTPSPPSETQSLSNRQLPNEKYEWKASFNVECSGPEHAQLWKVFFSVGTTMIGESTWFKSKEAAKENATTQALSWLNMNGSH